MGKNKASELPKKSNISKESRSSEEDIVSLVTNIVLETPTFEKISKQFYRIAKSSNWDKDIDTIRSEFDILLRNHLSSKAKHLSNKDSVKKQQKHIVSSIIQLKSRWVDSCLKSFDGKKNQLMKKEYSIIQKEYLKNGKILSIPEISNLNEYYDYRKSTLEEWSKIKYLVSEFEYLEELSEAKVKSAFKYDIYKCILDVLLDEYDGDIKNITEYNICDLPTALFQPLTRGRKTNGTGVTKKQDKNYASDPLNVEKNGALVDVSYGFNLDREGVDREYAEKLNSELMQNEKEVSAINKAMSMIALDDMDLVIIRHIYNSSDDLLQTPFQIDSILKKLNLRGTKDNVKKIENKLLKLPFYVFYIESEDTFNPGEKIRASFNLFSQVIISTNSDGRRVATVTYSNSMLANKVSTQTLYKSQLKKLNSTSAINLAYFLEGERVYRLNALDISPEEPFTVNLSQISWYVYMNKTKYNTMRKKIELVKSILDEIVSNKFIIKRYEVNESNGEFDIYFFEETEKLKSIFCNIDILNKQ